MSLLAAAGIYLVLDVNSPLPNHHLNRYEPWTSYNTDYLENIFKVVEQFSYYNNTLGYFAGNEIINDQLSAIVLPVFVKAVVRDLKRYIKRNSPRIIPVGYSAADDLNYRIPLSDYLECVADSPYDSIDFYGVNSYQWCGDQTFQSSGYDILVKDYKTYSRPVFLSEYGCNEVSPRKFGEVRSLYSNKMIGTFSGGLVYEFTQEPNNYGLVELMGNGDVKVLPDFYALRDSLDKLPELDYFYVFQAMKSDAKHRKNKSKIQQLGAPYCEDTYANLDVARGLPASPGENLIDSGVMVERGLYVEPDESFLTSTHSVFDTNMQPYQYQVTEQKIRINDHRGGLSYWPDKYQNSTYS